MHAAKLNVLPLFLVLLFAVNGYSQHNAAHKVDTVSFSEQLSAFYDISTLPQYLSNTTVAQVSSYDTTGGNNDGFSGIYSFVRRDKNSNLVIFDVKGAGVVNRIWTATPSADTLDFYIDDTLTPTFSIQYADLFSNKVYPFVSPLCGNVLGGSYCYLPIPFQTHCKIICRAKDTKFHQLQYRLYPQGTIVKKFSPNLNLQEKAALQKLADQWSREPLSVMELYEHEENTVTSSSTVTLLPGATVTVFSRKQGGRIQEITFDNASLFEGIEKQVDIKITWDDEKIPAVYCPVADFFGYAFGKISMQALLLGTRLNKNYCYLPMPFDKAARIELLYRKNAAVKNSPLTIKATISYSNRQRDIATEGKLYSCWNSNRLSAHEPAHVFLNTKARGHYVASVLQAQGMRPGMTYFFEGDDSTATDGLFRIHGTGSEDYFNGGWYAMPDRWNKKLSLPLHGALDYSLPFCRTGGYRFYITDKLSFEKNFFQGMEHGPENNNIPVHYTSLAFYYADLPPLHFLAPTNHLTSVYVPDTLVMYPQLMRFILMGNISTSSAWKYDTGGESFTFSVTNESALNIALDEIPQGRYRLYADISNMHSGCSFSIWRGQTQVSEWMNTDGKEQRIPMQYLGEISIGEFDRSLSIHFKTANEQHDFLLSRLIFIRENK